MTSQAIKNNLLLLANAIAVFSVNQILPTTAQNITPANNNDTGTIVNTNGNLIDIGGGAVSGNGANLFHSFQKFNLDANQTANFLSNPTIQNILGRVVGGDLSLINGLIQVTGSNANLFLMNPAGIVFGANAMLNVPASFTATTATGISFNNGSYNSLSNNNYSILDGNPIGFNFANQQPGSIINLANLELSNPNQNLSLVAGTVVSTGQVSAPNGNLTIASVEGGKFLRISQTGNLISLEIPTNGATSGNITVASLPQLLTGSGLDNTSELTVNSNGQVQLTASNIPINSGDVVVKRITSQTATLSAANNLTLPESQLTTTGDLNLLARDTVRVRDSVTNRVGVQAGGNLYIQGNQSIDILALNHPQTPFVSGGNLSLVSDGVISGDAHFASGGQFKILNLSGGAGTFVSYYDPIIRANGDVEFGDYTGAALKVETTGGIQGGNITITSPDISGSILSGDPDFTALTTSNAVILRAGLSGVTTVNFPSTQEGTAFTLPASPLPTGSITVGNINTSSTVAGQSGPITLEAPGNINTGNLNSSATDTNSGGAITLSTTGGSINTGSSINSSGSASSGNITLNGNINLTADTTIDAGSGSISVPISTINGARNLTLSANDITLGGAVGGTTALTSLTATAANTNVANNITTTGNIQFNSPVTLTGGDTKIFNSNNNNIDLGSTVDGASNLNVNAGTGNITLGGAVGGTTALTSLTTTAANTNIANNITTTGNIQFNSPITLTGADTKIFNSNNNNIDLTSTVDGASNLNVNAGTGNITLSGAVGGTTALTSLTTTAANTNIANNITTTGNIQFNSPVTLTGADTKIFNANTGAIAVNNTLAAGANNLTLTANEIDFNGGNNSVTGSGELVLQPSTASRNINLGQASDSDTSTFDLTTSELTALQDGFSLITIGRNDGSGNVNFAPGLSFLDPITIQSPNGQLNTQGTISSNNNNITLNGNVNLTADTSINAGSGSINFVPISTINGASNLTLSASGITLGGAVGGTTALTGLTATAANTNIANNITTTGNIQFNSPVTLTGDSSKTFTANTGAIAVNNTLAAGANNLTLTANEIDFNGGNNSVTGSGELVLQPSTASRNINLGQASDSDTSTFDLTTSELTALQDGFSLITIGRNDGSGSVNFAPGLSFLDPITIQSPNGQLNTQGTISSNNNNITLNGNVNLTADTSINAGSGSINFVPISTINGARNLTLSASGITLGGAVGGTTALTSLTATAANTNVANNITTTGNIQFNSPVTLTGDGSKIFNSNNNNIDLGSTVDGASNLNVNAGTGNITLGGAVGGTTALTGLTTTAANTNVANNITTTGNIQFNSPVTLTGGDTKIFNSNNNNIDLGSTVDGASNLNVNAGTGNITLGGAVGGTTPLSSLTATAANTNIANNITTTGNIQFNSPVTLTGGDTKIFNSNNNNIDLGSTVDGASNLNVNAGTGNITLGGAVGGTTPLSSLTATAANTNIANNITTTGNITLGGAVGGTTALTALNLQAGGNIVTDEIFTQGRAINLNSRNGVIITGTLDSSSFNSDDGGDITVTAPGGILVLGGVNTSSSAGNGGAVSLSSDNDIQLGYINAQGVSSGGDVSGGDVNVSTETFFRATDVFFAQNGTSASISTSGGSFGGDITVAALGGISVVGGVNTSSFAGDGGAVSLSSDNDIQLGYIDAQGGSFGGDVNVSTKNFFIATDVFSDQNDTLASTTSISTSGGSFGGDITVAAPGGISVLGGVNTNASSFVGDGGSVSLSSDNDIQLGYIDAQGGFFGGDVNVSTKTFFRATGVFIDQNGTFASISTSGGFGSGNITISHGGNNIRSFVVGNPFINGTAGAITSNPFNRISPDLSLPDSYRQEDIQIITNEQLPDADTDTSKSVPQPNPVIVNINNTPQVPLDNIIAARDEQLTRKFEQYLGQENSTSIKSVAEVQATLNQIQKQTDTKTAVFYVKFSPSNDSSTRDKDTLDLVILTGEGKAILEPITGVTRAKVRQVAQQFYDTISDVNQAGTSNYLTSAQQLYKWLIAPQEAELQKQGITNIAFILDEGLRSIPMAALHDGKQFLIEKYSLAVLPSFSLTDTSYASLKKSRVLAMGASKFTQEQKQEPLLAVPLEVATIAQIWQGTSLLEKNFTLNNLKSKRQQNPFSIIHLATHVDFVSGTDNQSYIQLYDQKLRLNQVRELGWSQPPVELLVLSACKSAFGDENAELGFAGLAIQTGVKSAVASLWYVSDAGTLGLMTDFYSQLKIVPIKAEALRQAQIAMIQGKVKIENNKLIATNNNIELSPEIADYLQKNVVGNLSHPFYWAPFTMIGSPW
ncbi:CHAT domain-containing protein [Nostoc sphaeroides]|uniref:CHAT domain-containing protein n=1 Tax=Nostoc sphaeroides CCNUC1 TaxID=2653204 RepID=A0A5P8W7J2_9NOSO|nr:CHAT domain-containing protein [Nostoc sphaeroides]QFS48753.1 CHAT domain-containing protein [Nostoc sphaeroides CCNUC1]